jgi:large subunit ribosomal protein L17
MRHRNKRFQLNRFTSWRKATLISLARSILIQESIKTTKTKAQAVKPLIERLITLAKDNTLFAKRKAYRVLGDHGLVSLLFNDIGPRFSNRVGGYTRVINFGKRRGDNAEVAIIELTEIKKKEKKRPKKEKEAKSEEQKPGISQERPAEEKPVEKERKLKSEPKVLEKPPISKKPSKKFLGGLRNIFKKERDSL